MGVVHRDPERLALDKPDPDEAMLRAVCEAWGIPFGRPQPLGGSFNSNVRIEDWVVRTYGPWSSIERVSEIQQLRSELGARGVPVSEVRPALDGRTCLLMGGYVTEVERFIEAEEMDTFEQVLIGMGLLGRMHSVMEELRMEIPPPIANHLPEKDAVDATMAAVEVVHEWGPTDEERRLASIAEELARSVPVVGLEEQVVHGDFKDNNVLFRGNDPVCVLDLDFAGVRPRIDDLALPIHFELQIGNATIDQAARWVDSYDDGLVRPLTATEREVFPFALARMPLAHFSHLVVLRESGRDEFVSKRGPACEWWLKALGDLERWQRAFA